MSAINSKLLKDGYLGGYDLGRDYPELAGHMLVAVTEKEAKPKSTNSLAHWRAVYETGAKSNF